jgi:probable rRNA maturation factor
MSVTVRNRQRLLKVDTALLKQIARRALELVDASNDSLSIALVDDKAMATFNERFHATPGPTDILTFDYGEGQGELIISVEHAIGQAKRFRSTPARELVLYVIHGILHLNGCDDTTPRRRVRMRAGERRLLNALHRQFRLAALIGSR